jgi:aldose 1-epimerase
MMYRNLFFIYSSLLLLGLLSLFQCGADPGDTTEVTTPVFTLSKQAFGETTDGQTVEKYTLKNEKGMAVDVITYGGIITSWTAPDKTGRYDNIVLGFDSLAQYMDSNPYFGAIIGRYGNRIAKGQFTLDGTTYTLATNNGANHLHGGLKGFDKVVWQAKEQTDEQGASLELSYTSEDMEEGYPGKVQTTVVYTLTDDNSLVVTYEATTDRKTILNLTQHTYFNLSGNFAEDILDHQLQINADHYLPVDATLIPSGAIAPVAGTPFDFRTAKAIGKDINQQNDQLTKGKGYDHCWALNEQGSLRRVATAYHPATGRQLEVLTEEPGIQFYSGNFLDGTLPRPGGGTYGHRSGFCLETQHYPDSPNQKDFPSVILDPGKKYSTKTIFKFSSR